MPISRVQDVYNASSSIGPAGLVTSITSTGGNTLVITGHWFNPNPHTGILGISDSAGNTWQFTSQADSNNPPSAHATSPFCFGAFVAWCINASAVTSVTVTLPGVFGSGEIRQAVSEWSGVTAADAGIAGTVTVPGGGNTTPGSLVLAGTGEMIAGAMRTSNAAPAAVPSGMSQFASEGDVYSAWGTGFSGTFTAPWTGGTPGDIATLALMAFTSGIVITTASLPDAVAKSSYSQTLTQAGGTGVTWSVIAGSLPSWATLNASTGTISGIAPAATGSSSFTVQVTDGTNTASKPLTLNVVIPQPVGSPSGGPWTLAFNDEFDVAYPGFGSQGAPNPAVWADHFINGDAARYNFGNDDTEWFPHNKAGLLVSNSVLTLRARFEVPSNPASVGYDPLAPVHSVKGDTLSFTTGWAQSKPGFAGTYGYWEARMKLATAAASWPSFWMTSADANWPPEFDVMEKLGVGNNGVIGGYFDPGGLGNKAYTVPTQAQDTNWHVWGMRWSPNDITWFLDGVQTGTYTTSANITSLPMHMQLQNNTLGTSGTNFPADVQFDYVRYWVVTGVPAAPVITSISPGNGKPTGGTVAVSFLPVTGATSYRVTACPVDGVADGISFPDNPTWTVFTGSSSPITATGLVNGARYCFSVSAINATGYSIESPVVPPLAPGTGGGLLKTVFP